MIELSTEKYQLAVESSQQFIYTYTYIYTPTTFPTFLRCGITISKETLDRSDKFTNFQTQNLISFKK